MNWGKRRVHNCDNVFAPVFQIGRVVAKKTPTILNVCGSTDAANHDLEVRFWSAAVDVNNSLGREQDACWLAGTAGVPGIAGNMLTISPSLSLLCSLLYSTFIRSSATGGLLWRCGGIIVSYLQYSVFLSFPSLYLQIEPEPTFNSPCCSSPYRFSHPFHPAFLPLPFTPLLGCLLSHFLALLINNPPALFSILHFLWLSVSHSSFWSGCQTVFPRTGPFSFDSITRRCDPSTHLFFSFFHPLHSTYGISSSLVYHQFTIESHLPLTSFDNKVIVWSSDSLVLAGDQ